MTARTFLACLLAGGLLPGCGDEGSSAADASITSPVDAAVDAMADAVADAAPSACESLAGAGFDPDRGFARPTEITRAHAMLDGEWIELGAADWSCLGTPAADHATAVDVTMHGDIVDFQTGDPVPAAQLALYEGPVPQGPPLIVATSDEDGRYVLTVPAGTAAPSVHVSADESASTVQLDLGLVPDDADQIVEMSAMSELTLNALPAFIGVTRTPGRAIVMGHLRDCQGRKVSGAVITVSQHASCPVPVTEGAAFYFSAGSTSLPVRHSQSPATSDDGLFMVIELLPVDAADLQVWGFVEGQDPATDEPTLLAQRSLPLLADGIVQLTAEARRSE